MKLPCSVTRDLLPLYAENMVEQETGQLIREHLDECPACREILRGIETQPSAPVEDAGPLKALKREIRRRRWTAAAVAALCVFIAVFTFFCHENNLYLVPWEDGLIEVKGIEKRPYEEVYGNGREEQPESEVDVLVLKVNSSIHGTSETMFTEEDGRRTVLLQGWSRENSGVAKDYHEMVFCPLPDRLIYTSGSQQTLLWGPPLSGGTELLPRLALGYYAILASGAAVLLGILWLVFRRWKKSWILRQLFFAPLSYLAGHLLIKGFRTTSFFLMRDFSCILLAAAAVYALLSLLRPMMRWHRKAG